MPLVARVIAPRVATRFHAKFRGGFALVSGTGYELGTMLTPRAGKRRGHTYCNYAQMGASVCLCVSDVSERNRNACFFGPGQIGPRCYLIAVGLAADAFDIVNVAEVVDAVVAVGVVSVAGADVEVAVGAVAVVVIDVAATVVEAAVAGSAVAFGYPSQRPSKRTHRVPSSRFGLPVIHITVNRTCNLDP